MSVTYPVHTLSEMAAIPETALARFLVELPSLLRALRAAEAQFGAENIDYTTLQWTDDREASGVLQIEIEGTDNVAFNVSYYLGDLSP